MPTKVEVRYRPEVIQYLEDYLRTCKEPNVPFMECDEREWNLPDVVREIKEKTELGQFFYKRWESLYENERTSNSDR